MKARKAITEQILPIIHESHFPAVVKDKLRDYQVHKESAEEFNLGYKWGLGGSFVEEVQHAVRMSRTGDACQQVNQVQTNLYSLIHDNEWAEQLNPENGMSRRGIGRAISQALMQGVWPKEFRLHVEQLKIRKAEHICWVSEPQFKSRLPHAIVGDAQLLDGDTGDTPTNDSIGRCQQRAVRGAIGSILK